MTYDYSKLSSAKLLQIAKNNAKICTAYWNRWERLAELVEEGKPITQKTLTSIEIEFPVILGGK